MKEKRKLVAHLTYSFGCGGLEMVIVNLVNASKNVDHVIISLTDNVSLKSRLPENVKIHCLGKKDGKDLLCHSRLFRLLKSLAPDVLHSYNFSSVEYHWTAKLAGIKKLMHSEHGFGGDTSRGNDWDKNIFRRLTSTLWSDYIVVSDDLKNWVLSKVKPNKDIVRVIHNGVAVPDKPCSYPNRLFTKDSPFNIVTVGRLAEVKNQPQLINAIGLLQIREPDKHITLNIIGEGGMRPLIENAISKLNTPESVILHGMQDDIPHFLSLSDAFVLSSLYEAMPMTVLESMAHNRPVICPIVGGVTDFISSNEAMLIEGDNVEALAQAISDMYSMPYQEREKLANAGYEKTKREYSVETMARVYEEKYIT